MGTRRIGREGTSVGWGNRGSYKQHRWRYKQGMREKGESDKQDGVPKAFAASLVAWGA